MRRAYDAASVKWKRRVRKIEEHEEMLQMAKSGTVPNKGANNTGKSGKYHISNSSDSKQNATTAVGSGHPNHHR